MGFFNFGKKKVEKTKEPEPQKSNANSLGESLEHLDENGDLPWGWVTRNAKFTGKISSEFNQFMNTWLSAKATGSPEEYRNALKSLIKFCEDGQRMCRIKGECFAKWYKDIIADTEYIKKRKAELKELEADFERLVDVYDYIKSIPSFETAVIEVIRDNDGVLQKDLPKFFMKESEVKAKVNAALYELTKAGKVEKIKQGRTNLLKLK